MAEFTTVGTLDEFRSGEMYAFKVGEDEIIVARRNGEFCAFESRCPHAYEPLIEGELRDQTITCAYHHIVFNTGSGAVTFGSATPLRLFHVRVEGDQVQVGPRKFVPAPRWGH